jgi:hypothetical protein
MTDNIDDAHGIACIVLYIVYVQVVSGNLARDCCSGGDGHEEIFFLLPQKTQQHVTEV